MAAGRGWGGLLRERDFRLLWIGESVSAVGSAVTSVALPLVAVTVLHASAFTVSVLYTSGWLPWLLVGLPAGAWVDRWRRCRELMLGCDAVSAVALASVPVAAWCGVLTLAQLIAVASVAGVASVFFDTAYGVYLPSLVAADDLVEGNTKLSGSTSAAQVVGPGVAGLIAQAAGAATGLLADAAGFAVSALCLLRIRAREPLPAPAPRTTGLWGEIAAGLRLVAVDPYLRVLTVFSAAGNLALTGWQSLDVVFLVRVISADSATVGVLLAVVGVGGIVGALLARRVARRFGTARGMLLAALCTMPCGLLVPLTGRGAGLVLFAAGGAVVSAGMVTASVIARSFRQRYFPAPLLGRVTAGARTISYGAIPIGSLLAGGLATTLGVRSALWVMTAALAAAAATLLPGPLRHGRDLPDEPPAHLLAYAEPGTRTAATV